MEQKKKPALVTVPPEDVGETPASNVPEVIEGIPVWGKFVDQNDDPFIGILSDKNVLNLVPVRGAQIKNYIRYSYHKVKGEFLVESEIDKLVAQIEAHCLAEGERVELFNRIAPDGEDILIDGGDQIYRISKDGWGVESEPVKKFRRFQGMKELSKPVKGGKVEQIFDFINVTDQDERLLILTFIIFMLVPSCPHPILVLYGPQGAAKSSFLRWLVALIDPQATTEVPFQNEREFMLAVNQRWLVGLDNVSRIPDKLSDLLCKLVTGAAFIHRRLYTDEELILRQFMRVVLINGINLPVEKPDLMDRCLLISLNRIPDESRLDETTLKKKFEVAKGEILGGCFDTLSQAMAIMPTMGKLTLPRLADFGKWACAIAMALGYSSEDFLRAFSKNIERQNEESLDASPVAALISSYFKAKKVPKLEGTPTSILRELNGIAGYAGIDVRQIPSTPKIFGRKLQEIRSNLEAHGYFVEVLRGKERIIKIHAPTDAPSLPSLESLFPNKPKLPQA